MTNNMLTGQRLIRLAVVSVLLTLSGYAQAHSGPLNERAVHVCEDKQRSQACEYEGGHNDLYIGTCQLISETDLICVRNKPIRKIDPAEASTENHHDKSS